MRKHRYEPMQVAIEPDVLQDLGAVRLEATVHVVKAYAGNERRRPVIHARKQATSERVAPCALPSGDKVVTLLELRKKMGNLGWVVLEVRVDSYDHIPLRCIEPGAQGDRLAKVPAHPNHTHVLVQVVEA